MFSSHSESVKKDPIVFDIVEFLYIIVLAIKKYSNYEIDIVSHKLIQEIELIDKENDLLLEKIDQNRIMSDLMGLKHFNRDNIINILEKYGKNVNKKKILRKVQKNSQEQNRERFIRAIIKNKYNIK